ncbi:16S rRNA (uracil(1498)-N(3))-methyltransferase [Butyrivibrio sp. MC2013]|uniref:16S rRNA (uracil(1498)-N(3))-methyltransferase n=1 Tax=Butyrivibrio sp. MC2013 TaxID=1280686 RepID=UPI00041A4C58|nr:16S rRNA (uracil(1498)-N(3))-methyltransferase [Butyrivibrio sp. MC2013]
MYHFFVEEDQLLYDDNSDQENCKAPASRDLSSPGMPSLLYIEGADHNHIANVLRLKAGDEILVSIRGQENDGRTFLCSIDSIERDIVRCNVITDQGTATELPSKIYLFQGLPKADKMELIIQKAVELGVFAIVPVAMKRSIVKLDEKKAASKTARWQAISEAAAKQSKRNIIPEVYKPISYKEALQMAKDLDVRLLPYENAKGMEGSREIVSAIKPGQSIAILIGPEGGFDDKEVEMAVEDGFKCLTLGKRILRTETAGFTMLAWLGYTLE